MLGSATKHPGMRQHVILPVCCCTVRPCSFEQQGNLNFIRARVLSMARWTTVPKLSSGCVNTCSSTALCYSDAPTEPCATASLAKSGTVYPEIEAKSTKLHGS